MVSSATTAQYMCTYAEYMCTCAEYIHLCTWTARWPSDT